MRRSRKKRLVERVVTYTLVVLLVSWILAPYGWLVVSSISTKETLISRPLKWVPERITLDRYLEILSPRSNNPVSKQFQRALLNSSIVALITTTVTVFFGTLSAYSISRYRFIGRKVLFVSLLASQMIPPVSLAIPLYAMFRNLNLIDRIPGLIMAFAAITLPFISWILKNYFDTLPTDLEEAARIDGCTRFQALFKIVVPLSMPAITAATIFAFIASWNEYFLALVLTTVDAKTMPVAVAEFSSKYGVDYLMISAGGVVASLPPVLLALIFQKFVISGLTQGAVKG
ncbi:MAG: carbohydrate ABC transporter permease [Thermotogae bacterium]|nr:carbohydrate ABC transporter permease [Thermotogota bacterium]